MHERRRKRCRMYRQGDGTVGCLADAQPSRAQHLPKNPPKRLAFFGRSTKANSFVWVPGSPGLASNGLGAVVSSNHWETIATGPGFKVPSKSTLKSSPGTTFTANLFTGQMGIIFNGGGAGFRCLRGRLRLLLRWRRADPDVGDVPMINRVARAGLRGGREEACEKAEGVDGVGGTAITSSRKPGWRCLPRLGREGMAKSILDGFTDGEGRMIEPATEEHLSARPRTSRSVASSITIGREWCRSVYFVEGREESSERLSFSNSLRWLNVTQPSAFEDRALAGTLLAASRWENSHCSSWSHQIPPCPSRWAVSTPSTTFIPSADLILTAAPSRLAFSSMTFWMLRSRFPPSIA